MRPSKLMFLISCRILTWWGMSVGEDMKVLVTIKLMAMTNMVMTQDGDDTHIDDKDGDHNDSDDKDSEGAEKDDDDDDGKVEHPVLPGVGLVPAAEVAALDRLPERLTLGIDVVKRR